MRPSAARMASPVILADSLIDKARHGSVPKAALAQSETILGIFATNLIFRSGGAEAEGRARWQSGDPRADVSVHLVQSDDELRA